MDPDVRNLPSPPELQWENWGEDTVINVTEVQLLFNGHQFGLSVEPLSPLLGCNKTLVGLDFISVPPSFEVPNPPPSPRKFRERLIFYLVSSHLEFGNYESTPKSELIVHSFTRVQSFSGPNPPKHTWKILENASRSFTPSVVTYVSPIPVRPQSEHLILVGVINTFGLLPPARTSPRKVPIGSTKVLNLLRKLDASGNRIVSLSSSLADAILSGRVPVDITYSLALASTPFLDILDTLYQADRILDDQPAGFSHSCTLGMLGAVIAAYRERALAVQSSNEDLTARWNTAHDLCSLVSCNEAFEDCKDGDIYDLDAVWQLTGLSAWIISLAERVLKECIMACDLSPDAVDKHSNENPSSMFAPRLDAPVLLHVVHPFALHTFITALSHVQKFCAYIKSLTARVESAQIARDVVVDLVSNSGIDFPALIIALERTRQDVLGLDQTISNLTQASIVTKATLFIKPHDLVEGAGNPSKKDNYKDVISKNILLGIATSMTCLQCGGKTALAEVITKGGSVSSRWRAWEKKWRLRCICGGRWTSNMVSI
ncbi:hypothetical protein C0991_003891 [Blastosporella zonata]|nr:hypothetical protein C0991_003891 [Blastosporella zonata]